MGIMSVRYVTVCDLYACVHSGRRITSKGQKDLDQIAGQVCMYVQSQSLGAPTGRTSDVI